MGQRCTHHCVYQRHALLLLNRNSTWQLLGCVIVTFRKFEHYFRYKDEKKEVKSSANRKRSSWLLPKFYRKIDDSWKSIERFTTFTVHLKTGSCELQFVINSSCLSVEILTLNCPHFFPLLQLNLQIKMNSNSCRNSDTSWRPAARANNEISKDRTDVYEWKRFVPRLSSNQKELVIWQEVTLLDPEQKQIFRSILLFMLKCIDGTRLTKKPSK